MMTGDTAQCIARGVGFRFADLGAMLYRHVNAARQSSVQLPFEAHLSRNYRSHAGILGVANLVSGLLGQLFPQAVDRGQQEQAPFTGPKPILLPDTRWVEVLRLLGGSNYALGFGAAQVVLVRSQAAKAALRLACPELNGCLVMTVMEAKGLEFNDVFLINFFADSPGAGAGRSSVWHTLLTMLKEGELAEWLQEQAAGSEQGQGVSDITSRARRQLRALGPLREACFDPCLHGMLCEELKHLYVALTRARKTVVIFDQDVSQRRAVFLLMQLLDRVQVLSSGEEAADGSNGTPRSSAGQGGRTMAVRSSATEWRRQGAMMAARGHHE